MIEYKNWTRDDSFGIRIGQRDLETYLSLVDEMSIAPLDAALATIDVEYTHMRLDVHKVSEWDGVMGMMEVALYNGGTVLARWRYMDTATGHRWVRMYDNHCDWDFALARCHHGESPNSKWHLGLIRTV